MDWEDPSLPHSIQGAKILRLFWLSFFINLSLPDDSSPPELAGLGELQQGSISESRDDMGSVDEE